MRALTLLVILLPLASARAEGIEELRVVDRHETITLRADGTATHSYRGRLTWSLSDERVGLFHAKFDPCEFRRLAALPGVVRFGGMNDFYLPYSTWIVRTTVVRDGKAKTVERHDRGLASDPEPPADLWILEMAVRGLASQLKWEPVPSGIRVSLEGRAQGVREVLVREASTNSLVAAVRTAKGEIEVPVAPADYQVEVSEIRGVRREELWKRRVSVKSDKYAPVNAPRGAMEVQAPPLEALSIDTPNFWWLHCAPDGSGTMGYGAGDATGFKAGTIDFAAAVRELRRVTTKEPPMGLRFVVLFREKGGQSGNVYTNDTKLVLGLFEKAARKEMSNGRTEGFDQLYKDQPPALERMPKR